MSESHYFLRLSPDEASDLLAAAEAGKQRAYVDQQRLAEVIRHLEKIADER